MTRACIIGISGYGEVHYHDLLRAVEAGTMEAIGATVIDRDQQEEKCRRLESLGCRIFTDHREMLDCFRGGVDLCFIPTGIPLHAPMTADALEAGANVYVEKPAAPTIQDVRAMEAAQSVSERFVAVGYQHMYADATLELKERLLSGEFGAIHWIRVRNASPRPASYYARNGWSGQVMRGGVWVLDAPFNNAHAHYVNMALFLAGTDVLLPAKLSSVQAELYRARDIDTADTACIRAITEQGVPVSYFGSHSCARANGPFIRIACENAVIHWDGETARIESPSGEETLTLGDDATLRRAVMRQLVRRIEDPEAFICTLKIARAQTLFANGAFESSPVNHIDESQVMRVTSKGDEKVTIVGIDNLILRAFEEGRLFSEMGVPWAKAGRDINMKFYSEFNGGAWVPRVLEKGKG